MDLRAELPEASLPQDNIEANGFNLEPTLLPTEQIGPKGWVRILYHFELPDECGMEQVTSLLRSAWINMKSRVPIAGCEAVPMAGEQAGMMQLRQYGDEIEDFTVKDLREPGAFPTFAELKAKRFPANVLDPDKVCKRGQGGEWPIRPGDRLNVCHLQLNFIKGGLILNFLFMHAYLDGTAAYVVTQALAEDVLHAQGITVSNPIELQIEDRKKLMKSTGRNTGSIEKHPEYMVLPFTPTGLPEKLLSPLVHGHVFRLSDKAVEDLKNETSPKNAKIFKDKEDNPEFISTNDALGALIWRTVMAAQFPDLDSVEETQQSMLGIALDLRRRAGCSVQRGLLGNLLGFTPAILDTKTLVREASLADLAILTRKAVASASDGEYLDSLTGIIEKLEDVNRLPAVVFFDMPGHNLIHTTWRDFKYYDIEWGPALGNRMKAIRCPSVSVCHGYELVLPDPPEGGLEIFVCAAHEAMGRLVDDPLWRRFVEKPDII